LSAFLTYVRSCNGTKGTGLFVDNDTHVVLASQGGFVELLVGLNDKVDAGQKVALQRNAFGEVVAEYTCMVAGEVAACRTDATAEPGTPLVFILFNSARPEGIATYPE
jgi:predicted deacylase